MSTILQGPAGRMFDMADRCGALKCALLAIVNDAWASEGWSDRYGLELVFAVGSLDMAEFAPADGGRLSSQDCRQLSRLLYRYLEHNVAGYLDAFPQGRDVRVTDQELATLAEFLQECSQAEGCLIALDQ